MAGKRATVRAAQPQPHCARGSVQYSLALDAYRNLGHLITGGYLVTRHGSVVADTCGRYLRSMDKSEAFRHLHRPGRPLLLPNVWEFGLGALLVAQGFPALGTTSLGVSAATGEPDGHPNTRAATVELAGRLSSLGAAISVDIADGFSADPDAVADLAEELADAGVTGVNIEDGRPGGSLAEVDAQCALIGAIKARVHELFVNARTDTHWLTGNPPAATVAIERAKAYADAGADGVFVPGLRDAAEIETVVQAVGVPLNLLFLPGGHTFARLAELGVARVSLGSLPYRMALAAAVETVGAVKEGRPLPIVPPGYGEIVALLPQH
jgi:2-methylisocitrate lyase-like PEP mutase family enzyme